uniref:Uncharacterized protein n=1 Tax=Caenorhabditis japonica TaxID=281687 RepID=A0A8R1IHA9_CAEJA
MERKPLKITVSTGNNCQSLYRPKIRSVVVHPQTQEQIDARSDSENECDQEDAIIIRGTTETNADADPQDKNTSERVKLISQAAGSMHKDIDDIKQQWDSTVKT